MNNKVFQKFIIAIALAALILTGAAPSFAIKTTAEGNDPDTAEAVQSLEIAVPYEDVPKLKAKSAILIDASTKAILYSKNSHEKRDPASMTKILNCMAVMSKLDLDDEYTITEDPEQEGTIIDLSVGETLPVKELMYGMMLESGNDAAEALAYATSGSVSIFCSLMNEIAADCGAQDTTYVNPNGLNPLPVNNVTTAYDLAMISSSAMKNDAFREIVGTSKHTIPATNKSKARKLRNTNVMLWMTKDLAKKYDLSKSYKYEGCTGIKTGYSSTAGYCLCASAKRENTELIAVVMGTPEEFDRFSDAKKILNYGFSHYRTFTAQSEGETADSIKVRRGEKARVDVGVQENLDLTVEKGYDDSQLKTETAFQIDRIDAPVEKGTEVGQMIIRDEEGKALASASLVTLESSGEGGPLSYIGIADEQLPMFYTCCGGAFALLIILLIIRSSRKRRKKEKRLKKEQQQKQIAERQEIREELHEDKPQARHNERHAKKRRTIHEDIGRDIRKNEDLPDFLNPEFLEEDDKDM